MIRGVREVRNSISIILPRNPAVLICLAKVLQNLPNHPNSPRAILHRLNMTDRLYFWRALSPLRAKT